MYDGWIVKVNTSVECWHIQHVKCDDNFTLLGTWATASEHSNVSIYELSAVWAFHISRSKCLCVHSMHSVQTCTLSSFNSRTSFIKSQKYV